ncbi:Origin recognition complex subunit 2 [Tieghemiomyces parasiticus]|uniref:Origin recognition complex subunit 2 n=1 Tax=Tieghemiomyces parasiticus TaxID=78921 RepID=A0A9W7ZPB7_9FUNG|nr:Origin recognition complex subunit 2 [Tieghemiomyces parasiticus]
MSQKTKSSSRAPTTSTRKPAVAVAPATPVGTARHPGRKGRTFGLEASLAADSEPSVKGSNASDGPFDDDDDQGTSDWKDLQISDRYARSATKVQRRQSSIAGVVMTTPSLTTAPAPGLDSPAATPRRRGRPRKNPEPIASSSTLAHSRDPNDDNENDDCEQDINDGSDQTPGSQVRLTGKQMFSLGSARKTRGSAVKSRLADRTPYTPGQPSRLAFEILPEKDDDGETTVEAQTPGKPKRRGRPPKSAVATPATTTAFSRDVVDKYNLDEMEASLHEIDTMAKQSGFVMNFGLENDDDDDEDEDEPFDLQAITGEGSDTEPAVTAGSLAHTPTTAASTVRPATGYENDVAASTHERYFQDLQAHKLGNTSNHTLAKLPVLEHDEFRRYLDAVPATHVSERAMLARLHEQHFHQWYFELRAGFSILFYGFGSKRRLLTRFATEYLNDGPVVVINGYFPTLTIRHIMHKILNEALELSPVASCAAKATSSSDLATTTAGYGSQLTDQLARLRAYFTDPDRPYPCLYLLVHNLEGPSLRVDRLQCLLAQLASCSPHVHLIASVDHIQSPLLWDAVRLAQYRWVWHDLTTFEPYTTETSFETSLMVQHQEVSATGIRYVLASLTSNAKGVFKVLADYQMACGRHGGGDGHKAGGNDEGSDGEEGDTGDKAGRWGRSKAKAEAGATSAIGLAYPDFYAKCRERFLVSSDVAFRAQLTEFRDHKIIQTRKGLDGGDLMYIPLDNATLANILDNMP